MITCPNCKHESGYDVDRGDVNEMESFYELPGPVVAKQPGLYGDTRKLYMKMCPKCHVIFGVTEWQ